MADQGDADAQFALGLIYAAGKGVPQDYPQAVAWYSKAAEQGDAAAQTNLSEMYVVGRGVQQDYLQAVVWYRKAAEQGNAAAQFALGCRIPRGVDPSFSIGIGPPILASSFAGTMR